MLSKHLAKVPEVVSFTFDFKDKKPILHFALLCNLKKVSGRYNRSFSVGFTVNLLHA